VTESIAHGVAAANARPTCPFCLGTGRVTGRKGATWCGCVLKRIFRSVFNAWLYAENIAPFSYRTQPNLEVTPSGLVRGYKQAEFAADVILVVRRSLDAWHQEVFRAHYLGGLDWRACLRVLTRFAAHRHGEGCPKVDRGNYFHSIYRLQLILGRAFVGLEPHCLFPVRDYYRGYGIRRRQLAVGASARVRAQEHALKAGA